MSDLVDIVRVGFRYGAGEAEILSTTLIRSVGPSSSLMAPQEAGGTWIALYDPQGIEVLRRMLPDPGTGDEVASPDGTFSRFDRGAIRTVVVELPWPGPGSSVIVHAGPATALEAAPSRMPLVPEQAGVLEAAGPPLVVRAIWGSTNPKALTLLFLPDGFLAGEMAAFHAAIDRAIALFQTTEPFASNTSALRVGLVDIPSETSGIRGTVPGQTAFSGHFQAGLDRVILVDQLKCLSTMNQYLPGSGVAMIVANTTQYSGSGGAALAFSCHPSSPEIALHELGHSAFGLADEYSDAGQSSTDEPIEPNVCGFGDRAHLKWADLVPLATPLPTLSAGAVVSNPPPAGVGAFEGAKYHPQGRFRAEFDCKMRTLGKPFCAVCARSITAVLDKHAP